MPLTRIVRVYQLCLSGAVINTSDYESAGLSLIPGKDSRRTAHPGVHPPKRIGR